MSRIVEPHRSSLGRNANVISLLVFIAMFVSSVFIGGGLFSWLVPIIFYLLEKESKYVKLQASQAAAFGLVVTVINLVRDIILGIFAPGRYEGLFFLATGTIWVIWNIISFIIGIGITIVAIFLMVNAYRYKEVELPIISPIAEKIRSILG